MVRTSTVLYKAASSGTQGLLLRAWDAMLGWLELGSLEAPDTSSCTLPSALEKGSEAWGGGGVVSPLNHVISGGYTRLKAELQTAGRGSGVSPNSTLPS